MCFCLPQNNLVHKSSTCNERVGPHHMKIISDHDMQGLLLWFVPGGLQVGLVGAARLQRF